MLIKIPPKFRRGRPKVRVIENAPPSGPLLLVSAQVVSFEGSDAVIELVFDNGPDDPIVDIESAVPGKWSATIEAFEFNGNTLESPSYNTVMLYMGNAGESQGEGRISYAANPSDVGTASGRMLAGFSDLPLG